MSDLADRVAVLERAAANDRDVCAAQNNRLLERSDIAINLIADLNDKFDKRFDGVDRRLDAMDKRMDAMDKRFDGIDKRLDAVDKRFDAIDERFDGVDRRFDGVEQTLALILTKLDRDDPGASRS